MSSERSGLPPLTASAAEGVNGDGERVLVGMTSSDIVSPALYIFYGRQSPVPHFGPGTRTVQNHTIALNA